MLSGARTTTARGRKQTTPRKACDRPHSQAQSIKRTISGKRKNNPKETRWEWGGSSGCVSVGRVLGPQSGEGGRKGDGNKGVGVPRIRVREVWKGSRDRRERWVEAGGGAVGVEVSRLRDRWVPRDHREGGGGEGQRRKTWNFSLCVGHEEKHRMRRECKTRAPNLKGQRETELGNT